MATGFSIPSGDSKVFLNACMCVCEFDLCAGQDFCKRVQFGKRRTVTRLECNVRGSFRLSRQISRRHFTSWPRETKLWKITGSQNNIAVFGVLHYFINSLYIYALANRLRNLTRIFPRILVAFVDSKEYKASEFGDENQFFASIADLQRVHDAALVDGEVVTFI